MKPQAECIRWLSGNGGEMRSKVATTPFTCVGQEPSDPDGDDVTLFFEWIRDGEVLPDADAVLSAGVVVLRNKRV